MSLSDYEKIATEELRLSDIISGFADVEEAPASNIGSMLEETEALLEEPAIALPEEEEDEEGGGIIEVDEGPNPEQAQLYFDDLRTTYEAAIQVMKAEGRHAQNTLDTIDKMAESFLKLKLNHEKVDRLTHYFRELRNEVRDIERYVMRLCIERAKMPRKLFIETFSWPRNYVRVVAWYHSKNTAKNLT